MTFSATRRDFLLAGLGSAIAAAGTTFPAPCAEAAVTAEEFLALSKSLTEESSLDPAVARSLLAGFLATGSGPLLADLVAGSGGADVKVLADSIVAAWYSGIYETGKGQALATYTDALVWKGLPYSKPSGYCGGAAGYWADPPKVETRG
jgi:hypothetical protein